MNGSARRSIRKRCTACCWAKTRSPECNLSMRRAPQHAPRIAAHHYQTTHRLSAEEAAASIGVDVSYVRRLAATTATYRAAHDPSTWCDSPAPTGAFLDAVETDAGWRITRERGRSVRRGPAPTASGDRLRRHVLRAEVALDPVGDWRPRRFGRCAKKRSTPASPTRVDYLEATRHLGPSRPRLRTRRRDARRVLPPRHQPRTRTPTPRARRDRQHGHRRRRPHPSTSTAAACSRTPPPPATSPKPKCNTSPTAAASPGPPPARHRQRRRRLRRRHPSHVHPPRTDPLAHRRARHHLRPAPARAAALATRAAKDHGVDPDNLRDPLARPPRRGRLRTRRTRRRHHRRPGTAVDPGGHPAARHAPRRSRTV